MNAFDIIVIIILAWTAFKGFSKGFVSQAAAFAALLLGIFGAIKFSDYIAGIINSQLKSSHDYIPLLAFVMTFILIVIGVHFIGKIVNKFIDAVALGFVNRIFGMLFSILKISFIISIILVITTKIDASYPFLPLEKLNNSLLFKPLLSFAPTIFPYLKAGLPQDNDLLNIDIIASF